MSSEESISGQSRKFTPLDTEYSYAGFQFVHAPYTIVEGLSVQGRSPEDYIVAQWFEESDEFDGEFSYNHRNHQPSIANNGSVITPSKAINPFKDESILPKILNMDPRNDDEIIAFYNEYGPLDQTSTLSDISPIARCAQMNGILESRKFFIQSVIEIQTVIEGLDILEDINAGTIFTNTEQLDFLERYRPDYWHRSVWEGVEIRFKEEVQAIIIHAISYNIKPVSHFPELHNDGFYPAYLSTNLLGAVWFQVYNQVISRRGFNRCLFCRNRFVPTSSRQKFCPDYSGLSVDHSPCENNYNQMKYRARKWYKTGLKTIKEIADHYDRPVSEIKTWMKGLMTFPTEHKK